MKRTLKQKLPQHDYLQHYGATYLTQSSFLDSLSKLSFSILSQNPGEFMRYHWADASSPSVGAAPLPCGIFVEEGRLFTLRSLLQSEFW